MRNNKPLLFVVGTSIDPHIDAITSHLGDISVCRLDVDLFPREIEISIKLGGESPTLLVDNGTQTFNVSQPDLLWFRRFGKPGLPLSLDPAYVKFANDESEQTVQGLLDLCRPKRWINEYRRTRLAASKPYQYFVASSCGLAVPQTLVTNSYRHLSCWLNDVPGEHIIKSISRPLLTDSNSSMGRTFAYTSRIDQTRISRDRVHSVPSQIQPLIEGVFEVRVTTINGKHIAVAISTSDTVEDRHDWRATQDTAHYEYVDIPSDIATALDSLMSSLGLDYAASDFIVQESGRWVFLESNPHGAWLWMENALSGRPSITEEISAEFSGIIDELGV